MEELTGIKAHPIFWGEAITVCSSFLWHPGPHATIDMSLDPQLIDHSNTAIDIQDGDTLFAEIYCPQLG